MLRHFFENEEFEMQNYIVNKDLQLSATDLSECISSPSLTYLGKLPNKDHEGRHSICTLSIIHPIIMCDVICKHRTPVKAEPRADLAG